MMTAELLEKYKRNNPFMDHCGIRPVLCELDHGVVEFEIDPVCKNPHGVVHGGMLFTMADCVAGLTARSDGRDYVTQSSHINFLSNAKEGTLRAEGTVIKRGRTIVIIHVQITDSTGRLMVDGVMDMFCTRQ